MDGSILAHVVAQVTEPGFGDFISQLIKAGDAPTVIVLGLWLLLTGKVRLGREYDDMRDQRNQWRDEALAARPVLREAADVAEHAVTGQVH